MESKRDLFIHQKTKWTHLSRSLFTQPNLGNIQWICSNIITKEAKHTVSQSSHLGVLFNHVTWVHFSDMLSVYLSEMSLVHQSCHLGVLVCKDMVVPGVGTDQTSKISETFCLTKKEKKLKERFCLTPRIKIAKIAMAMISLVCVQL